MKQSRKPDSPQRRQRRRFPADWPVLLAAGLLVACRSAPTEPPAKLAQGVNLTGWFQADRPTSLSPQAFGAADYQDIATLGLGTVRLPVNFRCLAGPAPGYLVPAWVLELLDKALRAGLDAGLTIILDNHSQLPEQQADPELDAFLPVLWQQLAFRYRDWPPELLFEIFNEPMDIADATWASLQARVLAIIRADNPTRTVIVTGAQWGGIDGLLQVQPLPDRHLLYSFHFYEPFLFTHQGADWSNLADFYGLPFPAGKALPWPGPADDERAAWWDYYFEVDQVQLVRERIASVADWAERHGVRLFCGEMGAYNQRMAPADRQAWYALAVAELRASNIPFTSWDYRDAFGVFRPDSAARFPQDLDTGILAALGLRQPPPALATAPEGAPVEAPLAIYDEGPARGIQHDSWDPLAQVRWLDTRQPASGRFCLSFGRLERYDVVGFTFRSSLDLSSLAAQGAVLRLNLQWPADAPDLELRWVQNPANGTAKPWRKSIRLGPPIVAASRAWQTIRIALADFVETGAWDGEWHEPAGLFDWSKVGRLEFVSEYSHLGDHEYRIDDLRLELP